MSATPISLVFLAYNEVDTIEAEVLEFYSEIVVRLPGSEMIVAEDGSTDGTSDILQRLAREIGIVHLTSGERKGYRRALLDAIAAAKRDYIFFSDTGRKHDAADFWQLYKRIDDGDLIVGRKSNREDQWYRKLLTLSYNMLIRSYFGIKGVNDCDSGFRLFNKRVAKEIFHGGKLFFRELPASEIVVRTIAAGMRYIEVPVAYHQRIGPSRGLPNSKLPRVILGAIRNVRRLKKELRQQLKELRQPRRWRICPDTLISPFDFFWRWLLRHQFMRFLCVGGVATIFDWSTFYLFNQIVGTHYQFALVAAWLIGTLVHYSLNRFFTFRSKARQVGIQLTAHIGVSVVSLGMSALSMYILVDVVLLNPMLGRVLTTGVMFMFNYLFHKYFTFNERWIE